MTERTPGTTETAGLPDVYISNTERVLVDDGPVTGKSAEKIIELIGRDIWRVRQGTLVVPAAIDHGFQDYAAELGWQPDIIVPDGIDLKRLDITDGLHDARVQRAITGSCVTSYVADSRLHGFVKGNGGTYDWGNPRSRPVLNNELYDLAGDTVHDIVNDKQNFKKLSEGIVGIPDGSIEHGLEAIASAISLRLGRLAMDVFVRNSRSGGGFGNVKFTKDDAQLSIGQLIDKLTSRNPEIWRQNDTALVETYDPPTASPAITMYVGEPAIAGMAYHSLQISRGGDYVGMISPTPDHILDTEYATHISNRLIGRLARIGYRGYAGIDLGRHSSSDSVTGYEMNGRRTGSMHPIAIGEGLLGPWNGWESEGHVALAIDRLYLKKPADFATLYRQLGDRRLLASRDNPYGAVISIPPVCNTNGNQRSIAGVTVLADSHTEATRRMRTIIDEVGDDRKNWYDDAELRSKA